ncbi:MAG: IclR family transcriptional regulator [Thermaerobacterales bacterium]
MKRTFDVLQILADSHRPLGVTEIGRRLGLPKASVYRLLVDLQEAECVLFDERTQCYRLGPRLVEIGDQARSQIDVVNIARPVLEKVAGQVGETINLGILDRDRVVIVDSVKSAAGPKLTVTLGPVAELHCSAMGKALLACLTPGQLDRVLAELELNFRTPNTITSLPDLKREIETARTTGLAYDREEFEIGLFCVAVAVKDDQGMPCASISVSGPVNRIQGNALGHAETTLLAAGEELSRFVNFAGRRSDG